MFFEVLLFSLLGILVGIITGLVPGLHPNTVFAVFIPFTFLLAGLPLYCIFSFIISLAISNTFTDFIPSIIFGAPEEDSVLSVLPGHKFLLEGRGYNALFLTVMGGLFVFLMTLLSMPFLLVFVPEAYAFIHGYLHILLSAVALWMVLTEKGRKKLFALGIFLLSGIFGFISLNAFTSEQALFPALTGLFALSTLLTSLAARKTIPEQRIPENVEGDWLRGGLTGWLAGILAGMLPGIGSAQAGVIAAQAFRSKTREFLIALGGINTSSIIFTFIMFYLLGKTRSGASWAISQVMYQFTFVEFQLFFAVAAVTVFISVPVTLIIGKSLLQRLKVFDYSTMTKAIIISLAILVLVFTGILGLVIAFTGMCVGILAIRLGVRRTHLMGYLMIPTIIYFSGLSPVALSLL